MTNFALKKKKKKKKNHQTHINEARKGILSTCEKLQ